jgi:preprotein translocase subunit SecG
MVIFVTILQLICALLLVLVVLFQSGKSKGLSGSIAGIADSYMAKGKARSLDAKLAKSTKWIGAVFVVLTLALNCMLAAGLK